MHIYEQCENDAWFSRNDRFDGFDRGDLDCDQDDEYDFSESVAD